ncbi:MAG: inositol oxygenase family protein [Pirellulaceae bacterium]
MSRSDSPRPANSKEDNPLENLDEWEDDVLRRYPADSTVVNESTSSESVQGGTSGLSNDQESFRDYEAETRPSVREFYRLNHRYQTVEFGEQKRRQFLGLDRARMSVWEAMEFLNQLVDDSDPDLDLPQIEHLLQTAEAIRADGRPRWFILTGLVHDLGKILCLWDEPQWAVVGDTFPVGCAFSERIVYHEFFKENPDWKSSEYQSDCGIYAENCGLEQINMSWGHDEYMYHVAQPYLPREALAMIRYHSCYPIHQEGAYSHLLQPGDLELLTWVREFNQYDLYTKRDERMDVAALRPFYEDLIAEFFPDTLSW